MGRSKWFFMAITVLFFGLGQFGFAQSEAVSVVDANGIKRALPQSSLNLLGAGIFRTKSVHRITGSEAVVRLKETSALKFEISGLSGGRAVQLVRLGTDSAGRMLILSGGKATGGRVLAQIPGIPLSFSQTEGSTTTVKPGPKLIPGEYGILLGSTKTIFCFAIEKE